MPGPDRQGTPEGLTSAEAAERLRRYGPNELAATGRFQAIRQIAGWLANPLIIILFLASAASAALGQVVSSIIIALMIMLGMALNFTQAYRSQVAARRLRERVSQRATVVRDGTMREIPAVAVVPGDVVHLAAGDLVPADGTLATAKDLFLNEAALTGESLPAEKTTDPMPANATVGDRESMAFSGTMVVSGRATGVVVETGSGTELGRINQMLASVTSLDTPLLRQIKNFADHRASSVMGEHDHLGGARSRHCIRAARTRGHESPATLDRSPHLDGLWHLARCLRRISAPRLHPVRVFCNEIARSFRRARPYGRGKRDHHWPSVLPPQ